MEIYFTSMQSKFPFFFTCHSPAAAVSVGWLSVWHVAPETVWRTLWLPLCLPGRTG